MRTGSTPAIVLRTREFGESDKIVTVLSRSEGKFTGIAKGAKRSRRRFAGTLEIFAHVDLAYRQKSETALCFLERAILIRPWRRLVTSLERYGAASHVVELADKMTADREVGDEIYALVVAALAQLDERPPSATTLRLFELAALAASGYRQDFERCAVCRDTLCGGGLRVPFSGTGLVCRRCADREQGGAGISDAAVALLVRLQAGVEQGFPSDDTRFDATATFADEEAIEADTSPRLASELRRAVATLLEPHVRGRLRALDSIRALHTAG